MDRTAVLALQAAAVAVAVVPLRVLHVFEFTRPVADLQTMAAVSRVAWSVLAVVGFAAVGYAHGRRAESPSRVVLAVAFVAALLGILVGNLFVHLVADVTSGLSLLFEMAAFGTYAALDAAMFGLLVLGGYALALDAQSRRSR